MKDGIYHLMTFLIKKNRENVLWLSARSKNIDKKMQDLFAQKNCNEKRPFGSAYF